MSKSTKVVLSLVSIAILCILACFVGTDVAVVIGLGGMAVASVLDDTIAALTAQVTANTDAEASATTLLNSIPSLIQAAVDKALAAGATPAQLQEITDLQAKLQASVTPLAAAVVANTPSSP